MVNINEMREEIYRKIELLDPTKLKLALNRVNILKEIQDIEEENIQN
ncbi:TPA: hypothetical protein KPF99_003691 [Clostridioides difficile]|uniref:Uncharacterized protein n=1 Tax=Clostridioides difficile TaxID=1496 RepID=A0A9X8WQI1_CLODI|nr:hypothetical protein [Clostridioides difficile]MCC0724463.1 hypothetical protein [Clostridioides sp. ZZV14-6104]MCC0744606.1 hypothetical protein [Clostridioides sp. ZZV14-6044]EIS9525786.1 hypothetical protein [Clostridioides difficile]EIS9627274.1 hypothetical protein [Clostridioides difficile]EJA6635601.1 hypothetical protein [Clostridioides difficile]